MDKPCTERRAHPRYSVKNNILLYNEITFAEIVNISRGGACCRFIIDIKDQHTACTTVDLLNPADKFYVQRLTCRDLNCHEPAETCTSPLSTVIRDCRLQFLDLADCQKLQLDTFIELAASNRFDNPIHSPAALLRRQ